MKIEAAVLCFSALPQGNEISILGAGVRSYRKISGDPYCHLHLAGLLLHEDGDSATPSVSTSVQFPNGETMTLIDRNTWTLGATSESFPRRYPISTPVHFPAADAGVYTITLTIGDATAAVPILVS